MARYRECYTSNQELNIRGLLKTGEIIVCNYNNSCEC